jgi:hypothetical protein
MKYKGSKVVVLSFLFLAVVLFCNGKAFSFGFSDKERDTVNLQTFVVSDFGDEKDQTNNIVWKAKFSRFAKPSDYTKELSGWDSNACAVSYVEARPLGLPQELESKQKWSLGIKAEFIKKGYNWIEVYPVKTSGGIMGSGGKPNVDADGKPAMVDLVGVIKSLDLWVWGGNYQYALEFYLWDYKGFLHQLPAGNITFVGWRNMRTKVPDYIPQAENRVPFLKPLKISMLKLWAYPTERVDQFYCYFDYMQVQTDVYLERFNGDDLAAKKW